MKSRLKRVKALKAHSDNGQTGPSAELLELLARVQGMSKEELIRFLGDSHK
jgi:hypothetical protein